MRKFTDEEIRVIVETCERKELMGKWNEIAKILNTRFSLNVNESTYRKPYQNYIKFKKACMNTDPDLSRDDSPIEVKKREFEKERKKLQTEKSEYNKWLRENARDELILEKIVDAIKSVEPIKVPKPILNDNINREYVLVFGDEHFGTEFCIRGLFGEVINEYSPEIFYQRMERLKEKTIEIIKKEKIFHLNIFNLGDSLDGVLRASQLMKLRYGVVDSAIKYAEYFAEWLNDLSKYTRIELQMTDGNHTQLRQLGLPKNSLPNENMGKVIRLYIKERLAHNPNFVLVENPTEYIFKEICGFNIMGIHGETSNMEKTLKDFANIYDVRVNYLIAGHMHHSKTEEIGMDCEVINVPSIIGVDPYGLSIRKVSKSSARLLVFEDGVGKSCEYTIKLN